MTTTLKTDTKCSLGEVVEVLQKSVGTEFYALAKCNCIVNLVTIMEVHLRDKVLKDAKTEHLLEGDFARNLFVAGVAEGEERENLLLLFEIRNTFVHEGVVTSISDQDIESFIHSTRSIIAV